ncbi:hypothetical protein C8Q78DRAFT_991107 [Trametes maxima]|nr:hypothetical protein C8Q78DRAFT_991107 [Trametes maxima]
MAYVTGTIAGRTRTEAPDKLRLELICPPTGWAWTLALAPNEDDSVKQRQQLPLLLLEPSSRPRRTHTGTGDYNPSRAHWLRLGDDTNPAGLLCSAFCSSRFRLLFSVSPSRVVPSDALRAASQDPEEKAGPLQAAFMARSQGSQPPGVPGRRGALLQALGVPVHPGNGAVRVFERDIRTSAAPSVPPPLPRARALSWAMGWLEADIDNEARTSQDCQFEGGHRRSPGLGASRCSWGSGTGGLGPSRGGWRVCLPTGPLTPQGPRTQYAHDAHSQRRSRVQRSPEGYDTPAFGPRRGPVRARSILPSPASILLQKPRWKISLAEALREHMGDYAPASRRSRHWERVGICGVARGARTRTAVPGCTLTACEDVHSMAAQGRRSGDASGGVMIFAPTSVRVRVLRGHSPGGEVI